VFRVQDGIESEMLEVQAKINDEAQTRVKTNAGVQTNFGVQTGIKF
jgi:hypothetical protein